MSLAEQRWLRLFTLCALYVAQGIPWGFMATTLPAYIKQQGVGAPVVASALAMTTLPYTFKWVWGPLMDVVTIPSLGRRRPWIMLAQTMMAATVAVMVAIDVVHDLEVLAWMILIHTIFNSMQDVAVDGLAVDLLDEGERGKANGLMYACKYGGGAIGGAGLGRVAEAYGLTTAILLQTGILLAIGLIPLLVRERSGPPVPRTPAKEVIVGLAQVSTIRSTFVVAIAVLALNVGIGVLYIASIALYTGELKWSVTKYTDLAGGLGLFAGLGGSVLGGFLADLFGRRKVIAAASIGLGAGWLVFAAGQGAWHLDEFVYPLAIWEALCQSVMSVAFFALCMDVSWPKVGATQFTAYMALSNLATTVGYKIGGEALEHVSYAELWLIVGCVQIGVNALLLAIDPGEARRKLPLAPGWDLGLFGILTAVVFFAAVAVIPIILLL